LEQLWEIPAAVRDSLDVDHIVRNAEQDHIAAHHGKTRILPDVGVQLV
jgi:hypothetical protein